MNKTHILAVAFLAASSAHADEILRPGNDINCTNLTAPHESMDQLMSRYGSQARTEELSDTEGEPFPGVALYPDDPHLRIEIEPEAWDIKNNVTGIRLIQKDTHWSVFGLKTGMTLEQVTAANGEPLKLTGFWQHPDGTYSVFGDFKPGRIQGGCRLIVFLAAPEGRVKTSDPLYGLEEILSVNPELKKLKPTVNGLFVVWRKPDK